MTKLYADVLQEIWEETETLREKERIKNKNNRFPEKTYYYGRTSKREKGEWKLRNKFINECPEGYEIDHIIPLSANGAHDLSNLQWLPKNLNRIKKGNIFIGDCGSPHCLVGIKEKIEEYEMLKKTE